MTCHSLCLAVLAAPLALLPSSLRADTFHLITVESTQTDHFVAGDDLGNFAIQLPTWAGSACGNSALTCFKVGAVGSPNLTLSQALPTLGPGASYVNSPLSYPSLGKTWSVTGMLGGIFAGTYFGHGWSESGVFDGTDPLKDYLGKGSIDGGLVSSGGNVFFIDGLDNTLVVALDTSASPAPEPTTFTLLGTGLSGVVSLLYRRSRRA